MKTNHCIINTSFLLQLLVNLTSKLMRRSMIVNLTWSILLSFFNINLTLHQHSLSTHQSDTSNIDQSTLFTSTSILTFIINLTHHSFFINCWCRTWKSRLTSLSTHQSDTSNIDQATLFNTYVFIKNQKSNTLTLPPYLSSSFFPH
jgi:hypothetical protein